MPDRNFMELLRARWAEGKFVCVGLDSAYDKLPRDYLEKKYGGYLSLQHVFNDEIVDATHDLVCAYKPNVAFYEAKGARGISALKASIDYIHNVAPDVSVILDAKRADIGNTNLGYVAAAFDYFAADAVTVHPYLGMEAMKPFLDQENKGIIVLCRTSNPGAGEFQDVTVDIGEELAAEWRLAKKMVIHGGDDLVSWPRMPFYQYVAYRVKHNWNYNGNCGVVVGATYPQELKEVREIIGDLPILIPGVGTQGGTAADAVENGRDSRGQGMIINASSSIIFASSEPDFAEAARREALKLHAEITTALVTV